MPKDAPPALRIPMTCAARFSLFPAALRVSMGACLRVVCMIEHPVHGEPIRALFQIKQGKVLSKT